MKYFVFVNREYKGIARTDEIPEGGILVPVPHDFFENDKIPVLDENDELHIVDENSSEHLILEPKKVSEKKVEAAMKFGQKLIIEFAGENVAMGITQAGKTKEVADYLEGVTRYLNTGSLYEVINEINRLKTKGLPDDLAPFISEERMNLFIERVQSFFNG